MTEVTEVKSGFVACGKWFETRLQAEQYIIIEELGAEAAVDCKFPGGYSGALIVLRSISQKYNLFPK